LSQHFNFGSLSCNTYILYYQCSVECKKAIVSENALTPIKILHPCVFRHLYQQLHVTILKPRSTRGSWVKNVSCSTFSDNILILNWYVLQYVCELKCVDVLKLFRFLGSVLLLCNVHSFSWWSTYYYFSPLVKTLWFRPRLFWRFRMI